jgi:hypothetical protein
MRQQIIKFRQDAKCPRHLPASNTAQAESNFAANTGDTPAEKKMASTCVVPDSEDSSCHRFFILL